MANIRLKGLPCHTNGVLPTKGQKAPDIRGVDPELKERTLEEFKNKKKIVCFVPSLDTPVCSTSAHKFGEAVKKRPNVVILYISCDLPFALKRVCLADASSMMSITPLSMIRSKKSVEDYGVLIQDGPLAGLCARAVVVLDEGDRVLYTELVEEVTEEPDYEQPLSLV